MGNGFLRGREKAVWDEPNHSDLVTLGNVRKEGDIFSRWLGSTVVSGFHRLGEYQIKVGLIHWIVSAIQCSF